MEEALLSHVDATPILADGYPAPHAPSCRRQD